MKYLFCSPSAFADKIGFIYQEAPKGLPEKSASPRKKEVKKEKEWTLKRPEKKEIDLLLAKTDKDLKNAETDIIKNKADDSAALEKLIKGRPALHLAMITFTPLSEDERQMALNATFELASLGEYADTKAQDRYVGERQAELEEMPNKVNLPDSTIEKEFMEKLPSGDVTKINDLLVRITALELRQEANRLRNAQVKLLDEAADMMSTAYEELMVDADNPLIPQDRFPLGDVAFKLETAIFATPAVTKEDNRILADSLVKEDLESRLASMGRLDPYDMVLLDIERAAKKTLESGAQLPKTNEVGLVTKLHDLYKKVIDLRSEMEQTTTKGELAQKLWAVYGELAAVMNTIGTTKPDDAKRIQDRVSDPRINNPELFSK